MTCVKTHTKKGVHLNIVQLAELPRRSPRYDQPPDPSARPLAALWPPKMNNHPDVNTIDLFCLVLSFIPIEMYSTYSVQNVWLPLLNIISVKYITL